MRKRKNKEEIYGVIGLGRFGFALAKSLAEAGKEVMAIDNHADIVKEASAFTDNAIIVENLSRETLAAVGIKNCDTVVICIGEKIDTSILTTMTVIGLGVPNVIAKATSAEQGAVLEKLGATVVFPERDMAVRLAKKLTSLRIMEYISLSDEVDLSEIRTSEKADGKTVRELNLRSRFGVNIIAVKHGDMIGTNIRPDTILREGDIIVVCGHRDRIGELEREI